MKYLLLLIMVSISISTAAGEMSRKEKAKYRAAQHPKGSGIGTNRYTTGRYDKVPYRIEKYQRVYPREKYRPRSRYTSDWAVTERHLQLERAI